MVFRLPTPIDSHVPPPNQQPAPARPWRGTLIVSGMQSSGNSTGARQDILVTAVETDGDRKSSYLELWDGQRVGRVVSEQTLLPQVQSWVQTARPGLVTIVPDRIRDSNRHTENANAFRDLAASLYQNQTVAIIPGSPIGIILFPSQNSSAVLMCALLPVSPQPLPPFITPTMLQPGPPPTIALQPAPQFSQPSQQPSHDPKHPTQGTIYAYDDPNYQPQASSSSTVAFTYTSFNPHNTQQDP
ncbi:hypothetical protein BDN72DRAFT_879081 [Pluteus cervinus]|uniref:Uncharacterized protein n=1 Tax=Pluteus cervinus TaxID=181527 RepID=A0ACD3AS67_9AGAR|nr:hypothetical protein BDN72DRAFT_879081 [Pluteus cervinus]